jgi:hypothetical protein
MVCCDLDRHAVRRLHLQAPLRPFIDRMGVRNEGDNSNAGTVGVATATTRDGTVDGEPGYGGTESGEMGDFQTILDNPTDKTNTVSPVENNKSSVQLIAYALHKTGKRKGGMKQNAGNARERKENMGSRPRPMQRTWG